MHVDDNKTEHQKVKLQQGLHQYLQEGPIPPSPYPGYIQASTSANEHRGSLTTSFEKIVNCLKSEPSLTWYNISYSYKNKEKRLSVPAPSIQILYNISGPMRAGRRLQSRARRSYSCRTSRQPPQSSRPWHSSSCQKLKKKIRTCKDRHMTVSYIIDRHTKYIRAYVHTHT